MPRIGYRKLAAVMLAAFVALAALAAWALAGTDALLAVVLGAVVVSTAAQSFLTVRSERRVRALVKERTGISRGDRLAPEIARLSTAHEGTQVALESLARKVATLAGRLERPSEHAEQLLRALQGGFLRLEANQELLTERIAADLSEVLASQEFIDEALRREYAQLELLIGARLATVKSEPPQMRASPPAGALAATSHEPAVRVESLKALEIDAGSDLFARGFLMTRDEPAYVPQAWELSSFGSCFVAHDPRVPFTIGGGPGSDAALLLLGEAFDLDRPAASNRDIVDELVESHHQHRLLDHLERIHGRYVVVTRGPRGEELLADATGMRTVFHTRIGGTAGSHASLVAANVGAARETWPRGRFGYPGRVTPYEGVVLLPPNQRLALTTGKIERIYPTKPLPLRTVGEVSEEAARLLGAALDGVVHRFGTRVGVSLTAGVDSRTTLSVCRERVPDLQFFTYHRDGDVASHDVDLAVATDLAERFDLNHRILELIPNGMDVPPNRLALYRMLSYYKHNHGAAEGYIEDLAGDVDVHIRSNLAEIGRLFYAKSAGLDDLDPRSDEVTDAYLASVKGSIEDDDRDSMRRAFHDFLQATGAREVAGLRDYRDLLYWEHRMGSWHGLVILESDLAFDTVSLYNSRRLLDVLLSAPPMARASSRTMREIVAANWPELLEVPTNPKDRGTG